MATLCLYLVERVNPEGYDMQYGVVVAATDALDARAIAAETNGDEGRDCWLAPTLTTVTKLGVPSRDVKRGLILRDFNAG